MKNWFFIANGGSKKAIHYTIPNINHLTSKSEGIIINWFNGNNCPTSGIINKITPEEIDFIVFDFNLYDYTLGDLTKFIQNLKE